MILGHIFSLVCVFVVTFVIGNQTLILCNISQEHSKVVRNFFWSWFLGITIPSLFISLTNVWLELPINKILVWVIYIFLLTLLIWFKPLTLEQFKANFFKKQLIGLFVFSFCTMLLLRFSGGEIIGGDSITYIYRSAVILDTGFSINNYDRNIIHNLPIVIAHLTGFSLIYSFKISISLLFATTVLSLYALGESLKLKYAAWCVIFGLTAIPLLRMYSDIIAFSFGITGLVVIIQMLITLKDKPNKSRIWFLLLVVICIQFSLHGLLSYSLPLFIGPILLDILLTNKKYLLGKKKKILIWLCLTPLIFGFFSQPSTSQWGHIFVNNVREIFNLNTPTPKRVEINPNTNLPIDEDADLNQTTQLQRRSLNQLSLLDNFYNNYSIAFLIAGLLGYLVLFLFYQKHHTRYIGYFFLIIFFLTQQNYLDLNWWPTRFVLAMYVPFSVLSVFAIEKLTVFSKKPQFISLAALSFLLINQLSFLKSPPELGYRVNLNPIRYEFLSSIEKKVPIDSPLYDFSTTPTWTKSLNPYHNIKIIPNETLCKTVQNSEKSESIQIKFQDGNLDSTTAARLLKQNAGNQEFFVIVDVLNSCLNQNLFTKDIYQILDFSRSLRLLKIKKI